MIHVSGRAVRTLAACPRFNPVQTAETSASYLSLSLCPTPYCQAYTLVSPLRVVTYMQYLVYERV